MHILESTENLSNSSTYILTGDNGIQYANNRFGYICKWFQRKKEDDSNINHYFCFTTGDTFYNNINVSGTSLEPRITGFGPNNTMRNMTNPIYQMEKNPLNLEQNPLANLANPLK